MEKIKKNKKETNISKPTKTNSTQSGKKGNEVNNSKSGKEWNEENNKKSNKTNASNNNEVKKINKEISKQKLENEKFKKYEEEKENSEIKQTLKEKKNKTKIFIITIIATILALLISVGCNIALGIELNRANILDKITFTKDVEINLETGNSGVGSVTLPNNILPGAGYNQSINFTTKALDQSLVMRAKSVFTDVLGIIQNAKITTTPNWQMGDDGYYYFNGVVNSNNSYLFSTEVVLPEEITQSNNNKNNHVLTFICETTRYDNASASVVWESAPTDWLLNYGSGLKE